MHWNDIHVESYTQDLHNFFFNIHRRSHKDAEALMLSLQFNTTYALGVISVHIS